MKRKKLINTLGALNLIIGLICITEGEMAVGFCAIAVGFAIIDTSK